MFGFISPSFAARSRPGRVAVFLLTCLLGLVVLSGCTLDAPTPSNASPARPFEPAQADPPAIELAVDGGAEGRVTVRGRNWTPEEAVLIAVENENGRSEVLAAGMADAEGAFSVDMSVPADQLPNVADDLTVFAFTADERNTASTRLAAAALRTQAAALQETEPQTTTVSRGDVDARAAPLGLRDVVTGTRFGSRFAPQPGSTDEPASRLQQLRDRVANAATTEPTAASERARAQGGDLPGAGPYAELQPASGGAGTVVSVRGGGFPTNARVNVYLAGLVQSQSAEDAQQPTVYASTTTDGNGNYSVSFTMPDRWPSGVPLRTGTVTVLVATPDFGVQASAIFRYVAGGPTPTWTPTVVPTTPPTAVPTSTSTPARPPTALLQPASGGAGTVVTVRGGGFPANTRVNVHLAGLVRSFSQESGQQPTVYASTTTDGNGNYSVSFTMPERWPSGIAIRSGPLTVLVATPDFSVEASALFEYTATAPTPTFTPTHTPLPTATPTRTPTPTFTPQPPPRAHVNVQPGAAQPGTQVAVSGGGFPANTRVNVYLGTFDAQIGSEEEVVYATAVTDGDGNFSTSITLPAAWPDGTPIASGRILVLVATENFAVQASDTLQFTATATPAPGGPTVNIQPNVGGPGTLITVTGGGFPANTRVNVHLGTFDAQIGSGDVVTYASTFTNGSGSYSMSFVLPSLWPGGSPVQDGPILLMVATDGFTVQATDTLTFVRSGTPPSNQPYAQVQPTSGGAGTVVTVRGGGFPANSRVNVHLAGLVESLERSGAQQPTVYASTTTDSSGNYSVAFTMPATWPDGQLIESGTLAILVASPDFGVQASAPFEYMGSTAGVTPEPGLGVLFNDDPRNNQRNLNAYFCSGFESECGFAGCAQNLRLVWGPYCREIDYPYIQPGLYRVTLYGMGRVRAGATDYGSTGQLYAFGRYEFDLPGSYTFCWPGRQPDGYGFETIVQSLGTHADVQRMVIEYLGPQC